MLIGMNEVYEYADKHNCAIPAFNTPNLEVVRAFVDAGEEVGTPIIIAHAQVCDETYPIELLGPFMVEYAAQSKAPVCLHLDHGLDISFLMKAVSYGFKSLMYDCSNKPFDENVARVKGLCDAVHPIGYSVEAELGMMTSNGGETIGGGPVAVEETGDPFTDVGLAAEFAEKTAVDALAICVGTVHGFYKTDNPKIDIQRVKDIRKAVGKNTRLVLHGSSGVPFETIRQAIDAGVRKINYYTYLGASVAPVFKKMMEEDPERLTYDAMTYGAYLSLKDSAKEVIRAFLNE